MLWTVTELKAMSDFSGVSDDVLDRKIKAIELAIRGYTNNNFQNRNIRIICKSSGGILTGNNSYFVVGNTIEISQSKYNDGLYTITEIGSTTITLDSTLSDADFNLVTKTSYPADILEGSLSLLKWSIDNSNKAGVASESLSRHSVTYFNMDRNNTVSGYPISLMGFCAPYMRAKT